MKIIRLSTFLDYGGIESKMANLSQLEDKENSWVFCALGKGGAAEQKIRRNGKRVICMNEPYRIPSVGTIVALVRLFKAERPDVVHSSGAEANFHGVLAARFAGVKKIVVEEIGIPGQSVFARKIFKIIYNFADLVLGESRVVTEKLKELYAIENGKLKVVPNFCVVSGVKNRPATEGSSIEQHVSETFNLVSVSRLEPVKNLDAVIRVVAKLKQENYKVKYTIVGDGSLLTSLKILSASLGLEKEVEFLGFVNDPSPYLLTSSIYILNSFTEGFSNSLLEAMRLGVPCLATCVGAAPEIINDWHNGWLVDVDEVKLYDKLKSIMELDLEGRMRIGTKGTVTVTQTYSLNHHVNILMDLYTS